MASTGRSRRRRPRTTWRCGYRRPDTWSVCGCSSSPTRSCQGVERPSAERDGAVVSYHVWDLERLYNLARSGAHPEPLNVDIASLGNYEVPCIEAPTGAGDYKAYLAIFPGPARVAVLDVWSEAARAKRPLISPGEGKGQRRNSKNDPRGARAFPCLQQRDLASRRQAFGSNPAGTGPCCYGNRRPPDRQRRSDRPLRSSRRGGRTRPTSQLAVAAKITVVPATLIDEFVPFISRYANSQNKVNEADFAANDPFHVSVEKMSRSVWAPAPEGTPAMTKWFYERARGQYADALARQDTLATEEPVQDRVSASQKFTKTDSREVRALVGATTAPCVEGAEKNFREFAINRGRQRTRWTRRNSRHRCPCDPLPCPPKRW